MDARAAILDAAFDALVASGPAFSVEGVARAAGVSKPLVFHHFGAREGLLDAMAARVLAETQDGLARLADDEPNPRERLVALARTLLEEPIDTSPAEARRVLLFWLADDATGGCRAGLRDALLTDFVRATVADGVATGAMRAGADAGDVARLLLARWHGVTALYAAGAPAEFEREAERLVMDVLRLVAPS